MKRYNVDYKKMVGHRIRTLRRSAHLSQDQLSERCGIYRTYLSRIEGGSANPTLLVMVALANALNSTMSDLTREYDATPEPTDAP